MSSNYHQELDIQILPEWIEQSSDFANNVVDTNVKEYARRGQKNRSKIIKDIIGGKIAELAVHFHLQSIHGHNPHFFLSEIDFEVYKARKKSFDADIQVEIDPEELGILINYHVKSFRYKNKDKYPISWMFQKSDKLTTNKEEKDDVICFTEIHDTFIRIVGAYDSEAIVLKELFREPKLPQLRHTKTCVYKDDLKSLRMEQIGLIFG